MSAKTFVFPSPAIAALLLAACAPPDSGREILEAPLLQLVDHLADDAITSGHAPMAARQQRRWGFHEPQPAWRPLSTTRLARLASVGTEAMEDGLRLSLSPPSVMQSMLLIGGLEIALEDGLLLADFDAVHVRARSSDQFAGITIAYNLDQEGAVPGDLFFFYSTDEAPPVFNDGSVQTYAIPLRPREDTAADATLESLGVLVGSVKPAVIDILSIELVPKGAAFLDDFGVRHVVRQGQTRSTLFAHTPATLSFRLIVPSGGRLDVALATDAGSAVTYRVAATDSAGGREVVFEEAVTSDGVWLQRSIDLSGRAGKTVALTLEATSDEPGAVGLWGAPVISGAPSSALPNVIFYIIDGGGADLMSLYGYERRTTPLLEELAREGAVFERAFSNSTWTQPSTASFMTSLHHSVLGGLRRGIHSTPIPVAATPMAVHMRRGGYQTASFSANPNSGRILGVERGVDLMRDGTTTDHSISSVELHEDFWRWRKEYPGTPYWAHFQTTDVHEPNHPSPPFAERWVTAAEREQLGRWDKRIFTAAGALFGRTSIAGFYDVALERTGISRQAYFGTRRGLYDETMAHQDHQLARFVEQLEARGEWENTLLILASDHGHPAGSFARWGRGLLEPQPEPWQGALFDAYASRVPLIFIWPGHIPASQRFEEAVSMIDVLPTLLDLVGLPQPKVLQGQSLKPLLTGQEQELRPVILDEFRIEEETGEMIGNLDIVDGRWGASLEIGPQPEGSSDSTLGRHAVPIGGRWGAEHPHFPAVPRLLLYDLEIDPFARTAVNDEHPELVEKYRALLLEQWVAHQALAGQFLEASEVTLTPEQLRQLRSLGYIQ
ncbi:MAG: sulfatase [Acidobacteria bacterium]|nr:sulfatase [Acidobacteriota bacterium]